MIGQLHCNDSAAGTTEVKLVLKRKYQNVLTVAKLGIPSLDDYKVRNLSQNY